MKLVFHSSTITRTMMHGPINNGFRNQGLLVLTLSDIEADV